MLASDLSPADPAFEVAKVNEWNRLNASPFFVVFGGQCPAAALTVCGSPVIAQGGPINECFGKSLIMLSPPRISIMCC